MRSISFIHLFTVCYMLMLQISPGHSTVHTWTISFICAYWLYASHCCSRYILIAQPFILKLLYPWDIHSFTDSNIGSTPFYHFLPCDFSCPNKTQLVQCLAGSYAATGSGKCQPCPKGAFCPTKGQRTYHLCANGTYSDREGLSDCKVCDAGFRCPSIGMEAPEECPNGTHSNSTAARFCVSCPEGHRWGLGISTYWPQIFTDHSSIHPVIVFQR